MNTDLVEDLALAAAEMKPLGLALDAYLELPVRVISVDLSDQSHGSDDEHVEILTRCDCCGRPVACKAKVLDGKIVADGPYQLASPMSQPCKPQLPKEMSAFRRLVFQVVDAVTH